MLFKLNPCEGIIILKNNKKQAVQSWFKLPGQSEQKLKNKMRFSQIELTLDHKWWI